MNDSIQVIEEVQTSVTKSSGRKTSGSLISLLLSNLFIIIFSGILFVFMEWLFFITKPSFLSASPFIEKIGVVVVTSFLVIAFLLLLSIPALVICSVFVKQIKVFAYLLALVPAAVLSSLALLLIDNFTYTVFKFGIVDSNMTTRGLYLGIWIVFIILADIRLARYVINSVRKESANKYSGFLVALATFVPIILTFMFVRLPSGERGELSSLNTAKNLPNIVLVTADGVNAKSMGIYGYERETTPFLDSIKDRLVISTNHFNNAANTTGSIISILNGKYPTETKVLFPPDVLKGRDSREHLVAILRDMGYYSAQLAIRHYIDASNQNLQDGFNESNGVSLESSSITNFLNTRVPGNSVLFIQEVEGRLLSRLKHILYIESMQNTFEQITETQQDFKDLEKIDQAVDLIKQNDQPVFVQIHWMGTHGDKFFPESTKFSASIDRENQGSWNMDLYDDAIVDFDSGLETLFDSLEASGELDSTLIIISSDHGRNSSTIQRLPLIIHLPIGTSRVVTTKNTQHVDIAPTILDIIGQPQPSWMDAGRSVFAEDRPGNLVLSAGTKRAEDTSGKSRWTLKEEYFTPPFYQFDQMTVIDCNRYYQLNLESLTWKKGVISTYVGECAEKDFSSKTDIRLLMVNRLIKDGFAFDQESIPQIP